MAQIESINPDRIQWCCQDRGVTPEELAGELGIAWNRFQQMVAGERGMSFLQLRKLASYFNRGVLFFLEHDPVKVEQVYTPQFRTIANQKPDISGKIRALVSRVEKQRDIFLSLREDLDNDEQVKFEPPVFPAKNIKRAAAIVRQWLELPERNDFDSYRQAVEAKGMMVIRSNGYNGPWQFPKKDPICGFTVYRSDCPVIVVKKLDIESRQVFTLMHELGHVLLHRNSFIDNEKDLFSYKGKEKTANAFAGHLLVPDSLLKKIDDSNRPEQVSGYRDWLGSFSGGLGVSTEVILRRLMDSGRLSQFRYNDYRKWRKGLVIGTNDGGNRQYRHREPKHVFGDTFVRTVLDALHSKRITLSRASTYLDNLKISDVHKLESYYAGI